MLEDIPTDDQIIEDDDSENSVPSNEEQPFSILPLELAYIAMAFSSTSPAQLAKNRRVSKESKLEVDNFIKTSGVQYLTTWLNSLNPKKLSTNEFHFIVKLTNAINMPSDKDGEFFNEFRNCLMTDNYPENAKEKRQLLMLQAMFFGDAIRKNYPEVTTFLSEVQKTSANITNENTNIEKAVAYKADKSVEFLQKTPKIPFYGVKGIVYRRGNIIGSDSEKSLAGIFLSNTDLLCTKIENINLSGAILKNVNLSYAEIVDVDFSGSRFDNFLIENSVFENVNFTSSILTEISFKECYFDKMNFSNSCLNNTYIQTYKSKEVDFLNVKIINMPLGYPFHGFKNLDSALVESLNAIGSENNKSTPESKKDRALTLIDRVVFGMTDKDELIKLRDFFNKVEKARTGYENFSYITKSHDASSSIFSFFKQETSTIQTVKSCIDNRLEQLNSQVPRNRK